jgi:hypothetical protein
MLANRATAVGNLAMELSDKAPLQFVVPQRVRFDKAANEVFVLPT